MPPSTFLLPLLLASASSREIQGQESSTYNFHDEGPMCEEGWSMFDNSCYKILNNNNQRYADIKICRAECAALGGSLGSIHSAEENEFITSLLRPYGDPYGPYTWLGAGRVSGDGWDDAVFSWEDGTPWDYSNWATQHPSRRGECALMGYLSPFSLWVYATCEYRDGGRDCLCKRSTSDGSCGANGSLGKCAQCLKNRDCIEGYYCCPYMKKCVNSGQMPCPIPVAYCRPSCYDNMDNHECTCDNEEFPDNWCP